MNILAVNDDGIHAEGLKALVRGLSEKADVYVCAPDSQRGAKAILLLWDSRSLSKKQNFLLQKKLISPAVLPQTASKSVCSFWRRRGFLSIWYTPGLTWEAIWGETLFTREPWAPQRGSLKRHTFRGGFGRRSRCGVF